MRARHLTLLDLELDDWVDPSLPFNRPSAPPPADVIGLDFTEFNRAFRDTPLFPEWTPVFADGRVVKAVTGRPWT